MQIFTCKTSTNICESQLDLAKLSHTSWIQFGQEALLYADESDWNEIANSAGRSSIPLQRNPNPSQQENLYLVLQKGRLFQQEHPEIPVLLDTFHHSILNKDQPVMGAFQNTSVTWKDSDGIHMIDYSSQQDHHRIGKHAEKLDTGHFRKTMSELGDFEFDLMLEIKDKEQSAIEALRLLDFK